MRTPVLVSWARWVGTMSVWPLAFAGNLLLRHASALRSATAESPPGDPSSAWIELLHAGPAAALAWPFDLARAQHAAAVQEDLQVRSLLAAAHFERRLDLLERMTLGPFARRV